MTTERDQAVRDALGVSESRAKFELARAALGGVLTDPSVRRVLLESMTHAQRERPDLAIAIMAGYLVVHYVALAFARADLLPPLLAAWTANIIFLGLGTSLFLRART